MTHRSQMLENIGMLKCAGDQHLRLLPSVDSQLLWIRTSSNYKLLNKQTRIVIPMNILSLIERADSKLSTIHQMTLKAQASLDVTAADALDRWLSYNWTIGSLSVDFKNGRSGTFQQIYDAFEPVRMEIKRVYGNNVLLYRGMRKNEMGPEYDTSSNRLYSWTFDRKAAESYAYPSHRYEYELLNQQEIDDLVARYDKVGYITYRGTYFIRNKKDPEYYDMYDRSRQHITDGDDIRAHIEDNERDAAESNDTRLKTGKLYEKAIPVEDIVWYATTSEKEVIVIGHSS